MAGIKLQKRDNDFFVSYGHADLARVKLVVDLLRRFCGLKIWFDESDGNAASRSSELLGRAIGNSRGAIFCLSEAWKRSSWCKDEYEVSLSERRAHDEFEVVGLRLDDVEAPAWLKLAEIIDLRQNCGASFARLLRSLSSDIPLRFDNDWDVYLAAPWSRQTDLIRGTLKALAHTNWRLVGDAPNFKYMGDERIEKIQQTTRGVVALFPHDASQPGAATSPYILEEADIARRAKMPLLLVAEPGVVLPDELRQAAFRVVTLASGPEGLACLKDALHDFEEKLEHLPHDDTWAFIFYAASLRADQAESDDIASVIERASLMPCVRGQRLSGDNVQTAIIDRIGRAALMIADVSDDHRNTLIECGIAMGKGTKLKLLCRASATDPYPRKRFMFEGQEIHLYHTPEQQLGLCYGFAREFRRQVYLLRDGDTA
jgi:TIR domain